MTEVKPTRRSSVSEDSSRDRAHCEGARTHTRLLWSGSGQRRCVAAPPGLAPPQGCQFTCATCLTCRHDRVMDQVLGCLWHRLTSGLHCSKASSLCCRPRGWIPFSPLLDGLSTLMELPGACSAGSAPPAIAPCCTPCLRSSSGRRNRETAIEQARIRGREIVSCNLAPSAAAVVSALC